MVESGDEDPAETFARLIKPRLMAGLKDGVDLDENQPLFRAWDDITSENREELERISELMESVDAESAEITEEEVELAARIEEVEASVEAMEELQDERLSEMYEDPRIFEVAYTYHTKIKQGEIGPYEANSMFLEELEDRDIS